MLANSATRLSDALRQASLLPPVRNDRALITWIEKELSGYGDEVDAIPEYRRRTLTSVANAFNGVWQHTGIVVPFHTLSATLQDYASGPTFLVQSIGTLEGLLVSESSSFQIPWQDAAVTLLNGEIRQGKTSIQRTYYLSEVRWDVPRPVVHEICEIVRHRTLSEVMKRTPTDELEARIAESLPAVPNSVAIQGSGNQIIVGSPGASAVLAVNPGDRSALDNALASLGIADRAIDELHGLVDDDTVDQAGKVMRAIGWSRGMAKEIGINTAGSAAATLILQYLGAL